MISDSIFLISAFRHDLSTATAAFSQSTAALSSVEEAHSLSRALAHLSRVEEKVEQVHRSQAEADTFHLFDLIKDYVALIGAIRETLNERNKAFQAAQHAQVSYFIKIYETQVLLYHVQLSLNYEIIFL